MEEEIYTPPTGPPQGPPPSPEIYAQLGQAGIEAMLADFYDELGRSPIAGLFPADAEGRRLASVKSASFFVGVLGGPPLYARQHGPPRMRARHLPFVIDEAARGHWLACWKPVLAQAGASYGFPLEHLEGFQRFLNAFSAWMVNRA